MNKRSVGEIAFDIFNHVILIAAAFACLYPMLYVVFASFSDPARFAVHVGPLWHPLGFSTEGYKVVFRNPNVVSGYLNTLFYVIAGTALNIVFTSLGAYMLSRNFGAKKVLMRLIVFTMYFGGGLIPNFLLVRGIGLYDSRLALLLPGLISAYNMIILKTAFGAIPSGLWESAYIDGANDFSILFRIVIPVSKASIAVITLFYTVGHWNSWFNAAIYLQDRSLWPLQLFLREILIANASGGNTLSSTDAVLLLDKVIKYCTIVVATVPILCVYPFCQKYFTKGVMVGSLKG